MSISTIKQNLVNLFVPHDKATTEKIVGGVFLPNWKWFRFTMCYFVCSDIAHFGDKGKQKKSISRRKTGKSFGEHFMFFFQT